MAGVYKFTIEAIDKSTAVARKIRAHFAKVGEPFTKLSKSVQAFGKESGLDKVTKSANYLGKTLGGAAAKAGGFAAEFETIASLGGRAGVAGMIAGVAATVGLLSVKWANFGFDVKQTSMMLGTSTLAVQQWRGAAAGLGVDAGTVDGSLQSLGDTLQDAFAGRNNAALFLFNRLGLVLKRTKTGAVDVNEEMLQLADVMARFKGNPEVQRLIARTFGVDPKMIPTLQQGRKVVEQQQKDAARFALSDKDVEAAAAYDRFLKRSGVQTKAAMYKAGSWLFEGLARTAGKSVSLIAGSAGNPAVTGGSVLVGLIKAGANLSGLSQAISNLVNLQTDTFQKLLDWLTGGSSGAAAGVVGNGAIAVGKDALRDEAAAAPKGPSHYMGGAAFAAMMDSVFGKGNWRQSGGWRSKAREDWLRRHGATTVRAGHTSAHSQGTWDAPGARDVIVKGMSPRQAAALLRASGYNIASLFPEGRSGTEGPHLHVGMAPLAGSVQVDVKVKHNGSHAQVATRSDGNVQASGKVEHSMVGVPG